MSATDIMYISMFSTVAPAVLSFMFFRENPLPLKILGVFILTQFALEIVSHVMYLSDVNNMWVFHVFTYVEFTALSSVYYLLLKRSFLKKVVLASIVIFYLVSLFGLKIDTDLFNSYQNVVKSGIVLVYCLLFLNEFFKSRNSSTFKLHPYVVLTVGFVVYHSGMMMVFLFGEDFLAEQNLAPWTIHSILNVFLNAVYCYALWETKQQETY